MYLVTENTVIKYAVTSLPTVTGSFVDFGDFTDGTLNSSNCLVVETVIQLPEDFIGNAYVWTGTKFFPNLKPAVTLSRVSFIRLLSSVVGTERFMAAWNDPNIAFLKLQLELAIDIARDDPNTTAALDALVAAEHMTAEEREQVMLNWPVVS